MNDRIIAGDFTFKLYDTYGFPLDLTELMARERGLTVDKEGFEKLMEEQRARARAAQKKEVISLSQIETTTPTQFVGYEKLETLAKVLEVVSLKDKTAVILDTSACYAEMGGQVGDTGELSGDGSLWRVTNTQKSGNTFLHFLADSRSDAPRSESAPERGALLRDSSIPVIGSTVMLTVEKARRDAIQRHHTVTHLLHWALHEVASKEASQKGSFVGPDKLTFDFNSAPLTPQQVADIEKLVNERILENAGVSWTEVPYAEVKSRKDVMQFFGDKYGDTVRVVQIGGHAAKLDGYSMELCGGTHTRATGEIGLFRIVGEKRDCRRRAPHRGRCRTGSLPQSGRRNRSSSKRSRARSIRRFTNWKRKSSRCSSTKKKSRNSSKPRSSAKPRTPRANCWSVFTRSTAFRPSFTTSAAWTGIFCKPSPIRSRAGSKASLCWAARRAARCR